MLHLLDWLFCDSGFCGYMDMARLCSIYYPGVDFDTNDVFIPADSLTPMWNVSGVGNIYGSTLSYNNDTEGQYVTFTLRPFSTYGDMLSLDGIDLQSSLNFFIDCNKYDLRTYGYFCRYECIDATGQKIAQFDSPTADFQNNYGVISVDLSSLPEGTVGLRPVLITQYIMPAGTYSFNFLGISFDVLTPGTQVKPTPIVIQPQDFLVNESSNGSTSTLTVSVPSAKLDYLWTLLRNDTFDTISQSSTNPFNVTIDRLEYDYWIGCQVLTG